MCYLTSVHRELVRAPHCSIHPIFFAALRACAPGSGVFLRIVASSRGRCLLQVTRGRIMEEYARHWPQYGFDKNYGHVDSEVHRAGLQARSKPCMCALHPARVP